MKKFLVTFICLFAISNSFSQKKEKLKGSKIVVIQQKTIEPFTQLEILNDIEINLVKGDKCGVELEADENLQDALDLRMNGTTLIIARAQEISSAKKFNIRVTYTDDLTLVTAKEKSMVTALQTITLDIIEIKAIDNSRLFLNINAKNGTVSANDKATIELNYNGETIAIDASKNASIKALVSASTFKCDLYQNAIAKFEGDVINLMVRIENNSRFDGKNLNSTKTSITAEGNANCSINSESNLTISATDKAVIDLYGDAKIEIKQFTGTAVLHKKILR